jgi:hypothetical protein
MARDIYEDHDEVAEAPQDLLGSGLVILTTIVLLAALFFMQKALAKHYNAGMFADESKPTPAPSAE